MIEVKIVGSNKPGIIHFDNSNLIQDANYRIVTHSAWAKFQAELGTLGMSLYKTCLATPIILNESTIVRRTYTHTDYIKFSQYLERLKILDNSDLIARIEWAVNCYEKLKLMKVGEICIEFSAD